MSQHPDYTPEGLKPYMESLAHKLVNNEAIKKIYDTFLGEDTTNKTIFDTGYFILSQAILNNILYIKTEKKRVDIPYNAIENLEQLRGSLNKSRLLLSKLHTFEREWIDSWAIRSTNQPRRSAKQLNTTSEMDESLMTIQNQINDHLQMINQAYPKSKSPYFLVIQGLYNNFKMNRFDLEGITQLSPSKSKHYHPISEDDWVFFQAIITRVFHEIFNYFLHNQDDYTRNIANVRRGIEKAFSQVRE